VIVVRVFLGFVGRHGFAPFGWWRIGVGIVGLVAALFFMGPEEAPAVTAPATPPAATATPEAAPSGDDALGDLIRREAQ
jgi:undecaprenyl-diphosphatase